MKLSTGLGVCAIAAASSGCSFLFVSGPASPADDIDEDPLELTPPECTTSRAAPVIDTLATGAAFLGTAIATADFLGRPDDYNTRLGVGTATMALFGTSAFYGYVKTHQCVEARKAADHDRSSDDGAYEE